MPDITRAYNWAIEKCNDEYVGYSQSYRNEQTVGGITYYDCSSFIWYALKDGGFDVVGAFERACWGYEGNAIITAYECDWLKELGFTEIDITAQWKAGDVLWRDGHTEMVYKGAVGSGRTMGAHSSKYELVDQVSINDNYSSNWKRCFRYEGGASEEPATPKYSLYVISAICGNWWTESNINPGIWESLKVDNYGYGLGQWTDNSSGVTRRTELFKWLDENGYSRDNPQGQLEYFIVENVWYRNGHGAEFNNLQDFLTSDSTDLRQLTYSFLQGWEGIWNGTEEERYQQASECYNYINEHKNDDSINTWVIGNRYLSKTEILNNAVMVYRYFCGSGGTVEPPINPEPPEIDTTKWVKRTSGYKFVLFNKR